MNLIEWSTDKYISYRMEGLECDSAFAFMKIAMHRHFVDFKFHAGEPMTDKEYSALVYILDDIRFTQNAELKFQYAYSPLAKKASKKLLDHVAIL